MPPWVWILIGALIVIGLIVWRVIAHASRRRAAAGTWDEMVIDAYAKGSALHDAISVAEAPGVAAIEDADGRWADIQRRADELAETLYALREAAPSEQDRARVAQVLAALRAVRSALAAGRAPYAATPWQAENVHASLRLFDASLRELRAPAGRP